MIPKSYNIVATSHVPPCHHYILQLAQWMNYQSTFFSLTNLADQVRFMNVNYYFLQWNHFREQILFHHHIQFTV